MVFLNNLLYSFTQEDNNKNTIKNKLCKSQTTQTDNELIISETNKYKLILYNLKQNKNYKIINWIKNRPADKHRINEIYNYYKDNNINLIPGIIYVWQHVKKLHIYDGLHRYLAAKKLIKTTDRDFNILVYINLSKNESEIIDEFTRINKSIPIPSIYLENEVLIKKQICEYIAEEFCKQYPDFISTSRKPHIYNFNRDLIIEWLSTFKVDFNINNLEKIIFKILLKLNDKAKNQILTGNFQHPKKCDKYNFYLFFLDKEYIKQEVELTVQKLF